MNSEDIIYPPFSEVDRVPELDKDSCEGCVYNDDEGACHIPIREISIPLFCGIHIFVRKQGPHAPDCAIALNGRHACSCMDVKAIPEALYSCGTRVCAEETSYPADMLFWSDTKRGWYCENCFEEDGEEKGISLAEEIERQKVTK